MEKSSREQIATIKKRERENRKRSEQVKVGKRKKDRKRNVEDRKVSRDENEREENKECALLNTSTATTIEWTTAGNS